MKGAPFSRLPGGFDFSAVLAAAIFTALSGVAREERSVTPAGIADAIQLELYYDDHVSANFIDVSVDDGVATLEGTTSNLLAKERAVRVAEEVKGVREVVDKLEVDPPDDLPPPPEELEERLKANLEASAVTEAEEVEVEAEEDGSVVLSGKVQSHAEKDFARRLARELSGVTSVQNEITVAGEDVDRKDDEIEADIGGQLRWNTLVDDAMIEVDVTNGAALLSGTVGSAAEKRRAREIASGTAGVKRVDASDLEVRKWERDPELRGDKYRPEAEEDIEQALEEALHYKVVGVVPEIRAEVEDGRATLQGVVRTVAAKRAAEEVAWKTVGVRSVRNFIKVRNDEERGLDDDALEQILENAFDWNPLFEASGIRVRVVDGTAYLNGEVGSRTLKLQAEEVASRRRGITEVVNNLNVPDGTEAVVYSDTELRENVEDRFFWSPFIDGEDISVSVDDEVVTLSGKVDTDREERLAVQSALEAGADGVRNRLERP